MPSIESAALFSWNSFNLATDQRPTRVLGILATPSLFTTLQTHPAVGRVFTPEESQPGADRFVVLTHGLWMEQDGGRADVIGESIRLNDEPYDVVGIMPEGFVFPAPEVKLIVPFAFTSEQRSDSERGMEYSDMVARLRPDATAAGLEQECAVIVRQNLERSPRESGWFESTGFSGAVSGLADESVGKVRAMLWLLQAGVLAALLIGCANVANLQLTRSIARERELAIRLALGAGRWRIVRQLLMESLLLFLIGGVLGLVVAMGGLSMMETFRVADLPRGDTVRLDLAVFLFTLITAGATGLVFGLVPALQVCRGESCEALAESGARTTVGNRQQHARKALVVAELALSLMLLATATLLVRGFERLQRESPGFDSSSVLTARLTLPEARYESDEKVLQFAGEILTRMSALPGVEKASLTDNLPFGHTNGQGPYHIDGFTPPEGQPEPHGMFRSISPEFFSTLSIPLLRGRTFNERDRPESEQVVIIDRVLAERYWPGEDPIGRRIYRGANRPGNLRTIVGVVAPVKHHGLDDSMSKETLYFPFIQRPVNTFSLTLRTSGPPGSMIDSLRRAALGIDPDQPLFDIGTMSGRIELSLANRRAPMLLIGIFSCMAVVLASIGVYGVLAFSVGQRTREFGIRMALGATGADVMRLVLGQGFRLAGIGVAIGLLGYLAVSRLLTHYVYGITSLDPMTLALAPALLSLVALAACFLPAWRAAKTDPMEALKRE
ncbi:MAG: ABC transporter permease [Verrucomicrobia bacterium]|nr:ABC transporter permease [Verrucomicrobiota bacterium]